MEDLRCFTLPAEPPSQMSVSLIWFIGLFFYSFRELFLIGYLVKDVHA